MEASVAIIQKRSSSSSDYVPCSPHDYDIIVLDEPSRPSTSYHNPKNEHNNYVIKRSTVGNHAIGQTVISLPSFSITNTDSSLSESVLEALYQKSRLQLRRAIPVPLFDDRPRSISARREHRYPQEHLTPGTVLLCAPAPTKERLSYPYGRSENLARLVNMCLNTPELLNVQTRHMLLRLDEWLSYSQRVNPHFLASIFICPSSKARILCCAHNPAYVREDYDRCIRYVDRIQSGSSRSICSSIDLDEKVRVGNLARIEMIAYNKYNTLIMNPLFGLPPSNIDQIPSYFIMDNNRVESSKSLRALSNSPVGPNDFQSRYHLHSAALNGDAEAIRTLIQKGYDVNEKDLDSWTPLHYACFYSQISATDALLTAANADVNIQNKGGATALHMAAINGNAYLIELLLSHPNIDLDAENNDGRKALELCAEVPKHEYQECAYLLRKAYKPNKIQVDLIEAGSLMVLMNDGDRTTAATILEQIATELNINRQAVLIFGLWLCSENLAVQLRSDAEVGPHLKRWSQSVARLAGTENNKNSKEEPRLVFRRNAHATLSMELQTPLNAYCLSLLYDEVHHHFLAGRLPSLPEKSVIHLAAILGRILYGEKCKITETTELAKLLPQFLLQRPNVDWKALINKYLKKTKISSTNVALLQQEFLETCRQLKIYGSTYFSAEIYRDRPVIHQERVWCAINDQGLHIISLPQHVLSGSYDFKELRIRSVDEHGNKKSLYCHARAHDHSFYLKTKQIPLIARLLQKLGNVTIVA